MQDQAVNILGKDFLGGNAIKILEEKINATGQNVKFILEGIGDCKLTVEDLGTAKEQGEMLVLRPEKFIKDGFELPMTVINFREIFRGKPLGGKTNMLHAFEPGANDWYKNENFALKLEIRQGWSLVNKNVLEGSAGKTWNDQENLLKKYAENINSKKLSSFETRRRIAIEVIWDTILYYANTGESLLANDFDWTKSVTDSNDRVNLGSFGNNGIFLFEADPDDIMAHRGVTANRTIA